MRMKFIGKTSCGFKRGNIYEVKESFVRSCAEKVIILTGKIGERTIASCPYESVAAIMRNWKYVGE